MYKGAADMFSRDDLAAKDQIGRRFILPATFTGSLQYMNELYQIGMMQHDLKLRFLFYA